MPGTIHVSVLDFKGLSSSPSSSISIKISMGRMEYQTWDKGEFSFPLTRLRDNLIVTLLDAEGNEISQTGVETMLVVEKGLWDDIFHLEGGGHVHMKLQFILSEEERIRIHNMRESALKKKLGKIPDNSSRYSETASNGGGSVTSSLCMDHVVSDRYEETSLMDGIQPGIEACSAEVCEMAPVEDIMSPASVADAKNYLGLSELNDDPAENHGAPEKTPSNVRNMISAFESSRAQDTIPQTKPPAAKSLSLGDSQMILGKVKNPIHGEGLQQGQINYPKRVHLGFVKDVGRSESYQATNLLKSKETDLGLKNKSEATLKEMTAKWERSLEDSETATVSGRVPDENSCRLQQHNLSAEEQCSSRIDTDIQEASDNELKSIPLCEDEIHSFESSGMWIFPDNATRLCVTSQKAVYSSEGCGIAAKTHNSSASEIVGKCRMQCETEAKIKKIDKKKSRPESSADVASGGPIGQATKIAIIVGFGVLVLLARQREPR